MKSVWKYIIKPKDIISIEMPENAEVLTVQMQQEYVCVWALVDKNCIKVSKRYFKVFGTGHDINESDGNLKYIGTFQMYNGGLVFHLFEIL